MGDMVKDKVYLFKPYLSFNELITEDPYIPVNNKKEPIESNITYTINELDNIIAQLQNPITKKNILDHL